MEVLFFESAAPEISLHVRIVMVARSAFGNGLLERARSFVAAASLQLHHVFHVIYP